MSEQPEQPRWVLLAYEIPRKPSAPRVRIWRKLRRLGAELLHGAIWVLPATARSREEFLWLAAEVSEAEGHASTWVASSLLAKQDQALKHIFTTRTRANYQEILVALDAQSTPLSVLIQRYRQVRHRDCFKDPMGDVVGEALRLARRDKSCSG